MNSSQFISCKASCKYLADSMIVEMKIKNTSDSLIGFIAPSVSWCNYKINSFGILESNGHLMCYYDYGSRGDLDAIHLQARNYNILKPNQEVECHVTLQRKFFPCLIKNRKKPGKLHIRINYQDFECNDCKFIFNGIKAEAECDIVYRVFKIPSE